MTGTSDRRFTTADLEALTEGATPGPWEVRRGSVLDPGLDCPQIDSEDSLRLAAAAPDLAAELHRTRRALEAWLRAEQKALTILDPANHVAQALMVGVQANINNIQRILEGTTNE